MLPNSRSRGLRDFVGRHSQILQNVVQHASLVVRQHVKNVAAVDHAAPLRTGAVHRPLEKFGRLRGDAKAFAGMLAAVFHPLFDQQFDRTRVDREITHRRRKKLVLLDCDRVQDMLDRDVILVALFRFVKAVSKTR